MRARALLAVALVTTSLAAGVPAVGADATTGDGSVPQAVAGDDGANLTVRTLAAPQSAADRIDSPGNVTALHRAGLLTNASAVPNNETLVVELGVPGFATHLDDVTGPNATVRFRRAFRAANASLAVTHTNPTPQRAPMEIDLLNASATHVVPDRANDTYHLVVDLQALNAARGYDPDTNTGRDIHGGEAFRLNLSVPRSSPLDAPGSALSNVTVERRVADVAPQYDGDLRLPPVENATVSGETTLLPGSNVTVRLAVGDAGDDATVRTRTVAVTAGADGPRYAASFDLADVANGTPVTVQVVGREGPLRFRPASGLVVEPTATVSFVENPARYGPDFVRVDARLAYPGAVVIRAGSADGPVVGARELAAGPDHDFVRVDLDHDVARNRTLVAMVTWDADGDGEFDADDPAVTRNGSVVSDDLAFAPAIETTTTDRTTRTTDGTATTTTDGGTTAGATTTDGQPGFGAVVALSALAAAALLARQ